jgi:hypothetical protein
MIVDGKIVAISVGVTIETPDGTAEDNDQPERDTPTLSP